MLPNKVFAFCQSVCCTALHFTCSSAACWSVLLFTALHCTALHCDSDGLEQAVPPLQRFQAPHLIIRRLRARFVPAPARRRPLPSPITLSAHSPHSYRRPSSASSSTPARPLRAGHSHLARTSPQLPIARRSSQHTSQLTAPSLPAPPALSGPRLRQSFLLHYSSAAAAAPPRPSRPAASPSASPPPFSPPSQRSLGAARG